MSCTRRRLFGGAAAAGAALAASRLARASAPASSAAWYYFDRNLPADAHTAIGNAVGQWIATVAFTPAGDWIVVSGAGVRASSAGVPAACNAQVDAYVNAGNVITCIAFPPQGGDSWIVVAETGATARNIPTACWNDVVSRLTSGQEITCVAFHPAGGWSVLSDSFGPSASGIPSACWNQLTSYAGSDGTWPEQVAFTPDGNGWTVLCRGSSLAAGNIPDECYQKMLDCRDNWGRRVTHVAFSPAGGWHVSGNDLVQMPAPTGGLAAARATIASAGIPGVSVAVVQGNAVTVEHAYGTVHRGSAFAVGATTRFQCASVSKVATAAGALRAIKIGLVRRLTLDTDIRSYLNVSLGGVSTAITLRQLLSHTGGFNVSGFDGYRRPLIGVAGKVPDTLGILQGTGNSPALARTSAVGQWLYSGGGYVIVQRFIEQASGQSFPTWMWNNVLSVIGMPSSGFVLEPTWRNADLATAHRHTTFPAEHRRHAYPEYAAAGLYATARDLAQLVITINQNGRAPNGATVWSTDPAAEMLQSQTPAGGTQWGLGVALSTDGRDGQSYNHGGVNLGYRNDVWGNPVSGNGVVVLSNYDQLDSNGINVLSAVDSIRQAYIAAYNL